MWIPDPKVRVRIADLKYNIALFCRSDCTENLSSVSSTTPYDDQYFNIVPGTGSREGYYAIVNYKYGWYLYCNDTHKQGLGAINSDGYYDDNWFVFEPGKGRRGNYFRMKNAYKDVVAVSDISCFRSTNDLYDDQFWTWLLEDMEFVDITYDTDAGKLFGTLKVDVVSSMGGENAVENHTSEQQSATVTFTQTQDSEYSFEHTTGVSLTVGAEFSVGVPEVAEGKISTSITMSHEFKVGSTTKTGKGVEYSFPVNCPPHKKVVAKAIMTRSTFDVPYTMKWKSKETGYITTSSGVLHSVQFSECKDVLTETDL